MQDDITVSDRPAWSKYWFIFKRRWFPAGATAIVLFVLMFANTMSKKDTYQATGQLRFNVDDKTADLLGLGDLVQGSTTNTKTFLATEILAMQSNDFLRSVVQALPKNSNIFPAQVDTNYLSNGLKVAVVDGTDVIQVSFSDLEPKATALVVNQFMNAYIKYNLQTNRSKSIATREFINSQLPQVRQRVYTADSALRRFKETYRIVDLNGAKTAFVDGQARIVDLLGAVETQLADVESQLVSLRRQLGVDSQQALAVSAVGQSPAVQETLKSVENIQKQIAEAKAKLAPGHPELLELEDRYQELEKLLRDRVGQALDGQNTPTRGSLFVGTTRQGLLDSLIKNELVRTGLIQQKQALLSQRSAYTNQAKVIPSLEQKLRELERELAAAEATYQALLKSLQEAQVTENQTIPTVSVIETGVIPDAPIGPNRFAELLRSAIASLVAAAAVAYLLEILDRKVKTIDDIREAYPYPILGNIPVFEMGNQEEFSRLPTLDESKPNTTVNEAYRMLQANLKFLRSDSPVRIIAVTSAQPSEGKSTTSSNLAVVLSQLGHKVLLIDADLRRPTIHSVWKESNRTGLSNVLTTENDEEFTTLPILKVENNPNLNILTAGPPPPNPLTLLDSKRMEAFLKEQAKVYDYVIVDMPPLTVAADPLVISRFTDGILLVARPEILDKGSINIARNTLKQAGANVLGVVVNGVILKNEGYNYYQYAADYYGGSDTNSTNGTHIHDKKLTLKEEDVQRIKSK